MKTITFTWKEWNRIHAILKSQMRDQENLDRRFGRDSNNLPAYRDCKSALEKIEQAPETEED